MKSFVYYFLIFTNLFLCVFQDIVYFREASVFCCVERVFNSVYVAECFLHMCSALSTSMYSAFPGETI